MSNGIDNCVDLVSDDDGFSRSTTSDKAFDDDVEIQPSKDHPAPAATAVVTNEKPPDRPPLYQVTIPSGDGSPGQMIKSTNLDDILALLTVKYYELLNATDEVKEGSFKCSVCWDILPSHARYLKHIAVCPAACKTCGEFFQTEWEAFEHCGHTPLLKRNQTETFQTEFEKAISPAVTCRRSEKNGSCNCVMCS